jgi:hypothetical protein
MAQDYGLRPGLDTMGKGSRIEDQKMSDGIFLSRDLVFLFDNPGPTARNPEPKAVIQPRRGANPGPKGL